MELLNHGADILLEWLIDYILGPAAGGMSALLHMLLAPLSVLDPAVQVGVIALFAAGAARLAEGFVKKRRAGRLDREFQEKMDLLEGTALIPDKMQRKVFRREVNDSADEIYMRLVMDRFFETGLSVMLPMFFFLIFLSYDLFTPEALVRMTGSEYIWHGGSGVHLKTGMFFMICFYTSFAGMGIAAWGVRKIRNSG